MTMAMAPATSLLLLSLIATSFAFVPNPRTRHQTTLFGIEEWREGVGNKDDNKINPILLLPFAANQALIQGQSTEVVLTQGRFFDLFQNCIDDYESIIGMALMGDDGFLTTLPLCEIDDFDVHSGYRGKVTVSVTLQAVRRADLTELTQMEPVMMGVCSELVDQTSSEDKLKVANGLVDDVETIVQDLGRTKSDPQMQYDNAYWASIATLNDPPSIDNVNHLTASSWAIFAVMTDRSFFYRDEISSVNLVERLQVGRKALLDTKFH